MTYSDFYLQLTRLSLLAPTDEITSAVLSLQIALDRLTDSDDTVGLELNDQLYQLFD